MSSCPCGHVNGRHSEWCKVGNEEDGKWLANEVAYALANYHTPGNCTTRFEYLAAAKIVQLETLLSGQPAWSVPNSSSVEGDGENPERRELYRVMIGKLRVMAAWEMRDLIAYIEATSDASEEP